MFSFYPIPSGSAGGSSFLSSLNKILKEEFHYSSEWEKADLILLNSHHWINSVFKLIYLRLKGKKFVIRIDGPLSIYRKTFFSIFEDRLIYSIAKNLCSGIVYQSNWSARKNIEIDKKLAKIPEKIIYNSCLGTYKEKKIDKNDICLFVSNSNNSFKGFDFFKELASKSRYIPELSRMDFCVIGNFGIQNKYENITNLGFKSKKDLAHWMQRSRFYIHPSKFEACSNALIESIYYQMIPLVYASSSNIEIVPDKRLQFLNLDELINKLKKVIKNKDNQDFELITYDFNDTANCYLQFFDEILSNNHKESKFTFIKLFNILFSYANFLIIKLLFLTIQIIFKK